MAVDAPAWNGYTPRRTAQAARPNLPDLAEARWNSLELRGRGEHVTRPGKLDPSTLEALVFSHLGARRHEVRTGPAAGVDAARIALGQGRVLVMTTDPLSLVPALGLERSAWASAHLVASDLWTTGIAPAWACPTLNLPPHLDDGALATWWRAFADAWRELGVAIVTGHTGRYPGCDLSIIGACTLIGIGEARDTVGPEHVRPGDRVIVTKGCAVETTAVVAWLAPARLAAVIGDEGVTRARRWADRISVVDDCRVALSAGVREDGVSALHDATEGGVLGGLLELARASHCDVRATRARIPLADEARAACAVLGVDPWWTLSEGTLIATARPAHATRVLEALDRAGIDAKDVGEIAEGAGVLRVEEADGSERVIAAPEPDPYWAAYERAVREDWR